MKAPEEEHFSSSEKGDRNSFKVVDQYGNIHICSRERLIGRGGQGEVLLTLNDETTAIKLAFDKGGAYLTDARAIQDFNKTMGALQLLPIKRDSHISMPIALLESHAGYVMRLFGGVQPLTPLMPRLRPNEVEDTSIPAWMGTQENEDSKDICRRLAFYAAGGSLRHRLRILWETADILAKLHASGLVFGDLSHRNLMVAKDTSRAERCAWLIDADNICCEGMPAVVRTPDYCAPETACKDNALRASDVYSFAILVFELMTMLHPFDGPGLEEDEENDMTKNGAPWILDSQDDSNRPTILGNLGSFITASLFDLCAQTFEAGKPEDRPAITFWKLPLERSMDLAIECPQCGIGWYYEKGIQKCKFCQAPAPERIVATFEGLPLFASIFPIDGVLTLPLRLFGTTSFNEQAFRLTRKKEGIEFTCLLSDGKNTWSVNGESLFTGIIPDESLVQGVELQLGNGQWPIKLILEETG